MSVRSCHNTCTTLAFTVLCLIRLARAQAHGSHNIYATRPLVAASWAHTRDIQKSLSDVLHDAMGNDKQKRLATDVRIDNLKQTLRPLFETLPKNAHGRVEHAVVRYALHRFFVYQHAMYIKGLDPVGKAWNSSSPAKMLEDQVPAYVQHVFEQRLHDGFNLHDLATFAATLEHIMHGEVAKRIEDAYRADGVSVDTGVDTAQLGRILDVHMGMHITSDIFPSSASREKVDNALSMVAQGVEFWPALQGFMREILQSTLEENSLNGSSIPFATAVKIGENIQERYGRWQDSDCRDLAATLAKSEIKGTGRITLADFYSGGWRFAESEKYLKSLGALDDSDPSQLKVIIPNYVNSVSNCVGTGSIYSTCCIDPCEQLLGHLEKHIAKPAASVTHLIELVSALPSLTIQAPRTLSGSLVGRLYEIASFHGGEVPLHGRLFAQWLHHAFPLECPFPHAAGTTWPRTADEWLAETGESPALPAAAREQRVKEVTDSVATKDLEGGSLRDTLPWLVNEELVGHSAKPTLARELVVLFRGLAFVAGLITVLFTTAKSLISATGIEIDKPAWTQKAVWV